MQCILSNPQIAIFLILGYLLRTTQKIYKLYTCVYISRKYSKKIQVIGV